MGIDLQGLKHLVHCKQYGDYKKTVTLGRQEIHISSYVINNILSTTKLYSGFCENLLLNEFGATSVDSIDNSDYENASIIWDMNKLIEDNHIGKFDTVIDYGTLEHVYHVNNALYNTSTLCEVGGQIIHILPSNNYCGHGFWQMSPELFFALYSLKNGYDQTEVFVMDSNNHNRVEKLAPPVNGKRILIDWPNPVYVAVRTVLVEDKFSHTDVQQSDYLELWSK